MALRLIEAFIPDPHGEEVGEALEELRVLGVWKESFSENVTLVRVLVEVEGSDAVVGRLTTAYEHVGGFQAFILPVEAAVPRPREGDDEEVDEQPADDEEPKRVPRVSIEELRSRVVDMSRLDGVFLALVVLSAVVASIGLLRDSAAIVIGSMVIAPLLGPSVALALATTLADGPLGRHALKANAAGVLTAGGVAFAIGLGVDVDPTVGEIASRTQVTLLDVVLGLAVGAAGVLSVTTGVSTALVGVMVAVALLPPLVVAGLLAGSGWFAGAITAAALLVTYGVTVSLAGIVTFAIQGVRPRRRWKADRARRATRVSLAIWFLLLAALAAIIRYGGLGREVQLP